MFGLIYKAVYYFFTPTVLNKGERDQPAPLDEQERHLETELARVRQERATLAARLETSEDPQGELSGDGAEAQ